MIDKLTQLIKNEKVKKGIEKIKSIPPKYFYIALAVVLVIVVSLSIVTVVAKNRLMQMATEVLPNSLVTFTDNNNPVYVTKDVQLLQEFTHNDKTYQIKWKSNNAKVIDNTGAVYRPNGKNAKVVLTASVKKGMATIEFPYELTVVCGDIINATEMQSLTAEAITTDNVLTGIKFDSNSLVINTDIDAALFAEYYINRLNNNSNIKVSFVQVLPSLTGKVFMFKQANQGVKLQDTFINVFVNEKGNPIEIGLYLETAPIVNDTAIVSEQDVISAVIKVRNLDVNNIYSITEEYVDTEKVYKITHMLNSEMYVYFITNEEVKTNRVKNANDSLPKDSQTKLYQNALHPYTVIKPNTIRGINIYTNMEDSKELHTEISKNMNKVYNWFFENLNVWSINQKGADINILVDKDISVNITRYGDPLMLFYFNHADGYTKHMGTCVDIIAHEYTHAVFRNVVGAIDKPTSEIPSIDEAYADVFACLIDGDWIVGEGLVAENKDLRNLVDNTYKYKDEYWSDSDIYQNSTVLSRVAYLMSQKGISNIDVAKIWYHSMFYGYHNESTFKDVQNNLIRAATALNYNTKTIDTINECFQEIGL